MDELQNILIGGTALVPLVIGLVSLAKRLGMPSEYAPWLNGILSTAGYFAATYLTAYPEYDAGAKVVVGAIVAFLASSQVYQISKAGPEKVIVTGKVQTLS